MDNETDSTNILEQCMLAALNGQEEGAVLFYQHFLDGDLYVPCRQQKKQLCLQPTYPNDFLDIVAVENQDKITIPVFSRPDLATSWYGEELNLRTINGKKLLEIIPDNWHLCVNPAAEVEKEFSPWELSKLRQGRENISEIVKELYLNDLIEVLEIEEASDHHYNQLKDNLSNAATVYPQITKLFLACEKGPDVDGILKTNLLLGIEANCGDSSELEKIKEDLTAHAKLILIGDQDLKVRVGGSGPNSIMLGIFQKITPFYRAKRSSTWLNYFKRLAPFSNGDK